MAAVGFKNINFATCLNFGVQPSIFNLVSDDDEEEDDFLLIDAQVFVIQIQTVQLLAFSCLPRKIMGPTPCLTIKRPLRMYACVYVRYT